MTNQIYDEWRESKLQDWKRADLPGPQTAEEWGSASNNPTPEMLAAAERLKNTTALRRANRENNHANHA